MKLTKVETRGFKSFADKTVLNFDGGVVGIVGPNGSGKSNINDAIKWVLGEMSAKSLRGDSMEDIIFAGSKTVKEMNKAEVSLTFDNSEGRVSIPHKHFTISRVLVRGGQSTYYINGIVARLKDIKEITMESGMSKSSLAIISQGTVADIAQATPEDRRLIFEEAAGVSKYKARKKDAMNKLDKTAESLEKVQAVSNELNRQLKPLRRQAEKARQYLALKEKLRDVEVSLIFEDVSFYSEKLKELNIELEDVITSKEDIEIQLSEIASNLNVKSQQKSDQENDVHELDIKLDALNEKLGKLNSTHNEAQQRRKLIIEGEYKADNKARIAALKEELDELSQKILSFKKFEIENQETILEKKEEISQTQTKIYELRSLINQRNVVYQKLKAKHSYLSEQQKNRGNLHRGVRVILDNKDSMQGVYGIVADLFTIDKEFHKAIETAAKSSLQNIVTATPEDAVKAVKFLKENKSGSASFMPLSTTEPRNVPVNFIQIATQQRGFIDIASNLVHTDPKFAVIKHSILGNVLVVTKIEEGSYIAKLFGNRFTIVTMEGDIIKPGGIITGGSYGRSNNLLGIEDELESIEAKIPSLEDQLGDYKSELTKWETSVEGEQITIAQCNLELAKIQEKLSLYENQFSSLKVQYETISDKKFEEVSSTGASHIVEMETLEHERTTIRSTVRAKKENMISLNREITRQTILKNDLDNMLRTILETSSEKMTLKNQAEFILENSKKRLFEEYEMTIERASEIESLKIDIEEARVIVKELREEIRDLGNVNLDSIKDFDEINERFEKIRAAEEELFNAKETILSAISQMDNIITTRLDETVTAVNKEMGAIFRVMFGGGEARVKYTDPKNLLETGIEVVAQPPGKTVKKLKLFSGGEKALVAISLLFSILKSKPLPLCILDEVEAALDDANVIRYANYLQELKDKTQFIVVTHRVGTMSRVDKLFGATMQKRGVTSFFTVELSEAKKLLTE